MIIYKVVNEINGKVYIGQTKNSLNKRKHEHLQDAKHHRDNCWRFCHAIRKYGFRNFRWGVIYESDNQKDIDEREKFYINQYDDNNRYNVIDGPCGTYKRTLHIRKRISETQKKKWQKGEYTKKYGPKHSVEIKRIIGLSSKKRNENKEYKERAVQTLSKFWGCKHSEKTKKRMSNKAKTRPRDKFGRFIKENIK
jgi:group I intron endonuclease